MGQTIQAIIFYAWLLGVLVLLFLIWRNGTTRTARLTQALIDLGNKGADAAKVAAEAAQRAVALVEKKGNDK
jgi:hypothetical protein